jgi:hypothetical protein
MYVALIGDSGTARKSTAVRVATDYVRRLYASTEEIALLDSRMTAEALDQLLHDMTEMHGSSQVAVAVSEMAVFLGTERYLAAMPILLTDLYDCPSHRRGGGTITRGECIQRNVWISMLTASTPIWLLKCINPNVIEGGFTSRCYFIISNAPKRRIAWPTHVDSAEEAEAIFRDLTYVRDMANMHPSIGLTYGAMVEFTDWYDHRDPSLDPFKQSFEAREDAHVLRVAALLAINEDVWQIEQHHITTAIQLIGGIKEDSNQIFQNAEAQTKFALALDVIRATLISTGMDPIPRHQLYIRCRSKLDHTEFMTLLEVLHEIGAIQRYNYRAGDHGRPTDFIRGTELLLSRGLGERVMEKFL